MKAFLVIVAAAAALSAQQADLIIVGGKIATLGPKGDVQAVGIGNGKIVVVGTEAEVRAKAGPGVRTINLNGALAVPGLIEGHGHFTGVGRMRMEINLRDCKTWDEIVSRVGDAAKKAKPDEWIIGRGWHQEKWTKPPSPAILGFPVHAALSQATPNNPVILTHASGHAAFVNAAALAKAGISSTTPNPSGGEIAKDSSGNPPDCSRNRLRGWSIARARRSSERVLKRIAMPMRGANSSSHRKKRYRRDSRRFRMPDRPSRQLT